MSEETRTEKTPEERAETERNISILIDEAFALREEVRELTRQTKEKDGEFKKKMARVQFLMNENGIKQTATDLTTVKVSATLSPSKIDWHIVHAYVMETGDFSLIKRAMNSAAYKELYEVDEELAKSMATPYERQTLNMTAKPNKSRK